MSLAQRSDNDDMINRQLEQLLEQQRAMWEPDPTDFEQEGFEQEDLDYQRYMSLMPNNSTHSSTTFPLYTHVMRSIYRTTIVVERLE